VVFVIPIVVLEVVAVVAAAVDNLFVELDHSSYSLTDAEDDKYDFDCYKLIDLDHLILFLGLNFEIISDKFFIEYHYS
jgi:hypothetical protein